MKEFEQRRQGVSTALVTRKVDALLLASPANVRYLTGYAGSSGLVLITRLDAHFFTDPRYASDARQNIDCRVHIARKSLIEGVTALIKRKKLKRIGFEPAHLTVEQYQHLKENLPVGTGLYPAGGLVEGFRAVKSPAEIELIRNSVMANSDAYYRTMRRVKLGARERDIAAELDFQMRMLGAEKPAFETIVAAGPRSALPHAQPTAKRVDENELLLVDMGATLDGYTSDMTRVSYMGIPTRRVRGLYKAVLEAQLAAIDAVQPGIAASKVDAKAREVLKQHELERAFVHSTGHGLGLEIHETPRIARKEQTKLQAGMVITVEPGVYIDGLGGIRIEDTVLVTEHGCEVLTPTTKEFIHL